MLNSKSYFVMRNVANEMIDTFHNFSHIWISIFSCLRLSLIDIVTIKLRTYSTTHVINTMNTN